MVVFLLPPVYMKHTYLRKGQLVSHGIKRRVLKKERKNPALPFARVALMPVPL